MLRILWTPLVNDVRVFVCRSDRFRMNQIIASIFCSHEAQLPKNCDFGAEFQINLPFHFHIQSGQ